MQQGQQVSDRDGAPSVTLFAIINVGGLPYGLVAGSVMETFGRRQVPPGRPIFQGHLWKINTLENPGGVSEQLQTVPALVPFVLILYTIVSALRLFHCVALHISPANVPVCFAFSCNALYV